MGSVATRCASPTARSTVQRTTWIGLTLGAAQNLTALQARSARIPLRDSAEVVARRLAEHSRETGWNVSVVDSADEPARDDSKET